MFEPAPALLASRAPPDRTSLGTSGFLPIGWGAEFGRGSSVTEPIHIHVPKTAGTSIRRALGLTHFDRSERTSHVAWGEPPMTKWYSEATDPYLFSCVRHPCDRAVSIHAHFAKRVSRTINGSVAPNRETGDEARHHQRGSAMHRDELIDFLAARLSTATPSPTQRR